MSDDGLGKKLEFIPKMILMNISKESKDQNQNSAHLSFGKTRQGEDNSGYRSSDQCQHQWPDK